MFFVINYKYPVVNDKRFVVNDKCSVVNDKCLVINDKYPVFNDKCLVVNDKYLSSTINICRQRQVSSTSKLQL